MLDKTFRPAEVEAKHFADWERSGAFAADLHSKAEPYTIMMPPPNVTGSLHIGHALTFTLQDMLIRYHRMRGCDALWQPGTDHAGIATQMVVERQLAEQGIVLKRAGVAAATRPPSAARRSSPRSGNGRPSPAARSSPAPPARRVGGLGARALHHGRGL